MKPSIENAFNITIDEIPTKMENFESIKNHKKISFDFMDFCDLWDKKQAFIDYIASRNDNTIIDLLLDDFAPTTSVIAEHSTAIILNID